MRKLLFGILLALPALVWSQQASFVIEGTVAKFLHQPDKIYLRYSTDGERRLDSSEVKDGKFRFTNTIAEPVLASIMVKYKTGKDGIIVPLVQSRDAASIFISLAKMKVTATDSMTNIKVTGSEAHKEYEKLVKLLENADAELDARIADYRATQDENKKKQIEKQLDSVYAKMDDIHKAYFLANVSSPIAMYALREIAGSFVDAEKVQPLFDALPEATKQLPSSKQLAERLEIAHKLAIGKPAMDFTQNDTLDKPVTLSSLRGKVLLVDFWASWCGPCRRDNPNIVKAFNQYKDKGFHVLGVSLDRATGKDRWMKAIHDDQLAWTQVSDLKFWDNEVAKLYGVRAIPFNLLLDREGKIIARNLHGDELEKKLQEVLQ